MLSVPSIKSAFKKQLKGKEVSIHFLTNNHGTQVGICNYGARITHFIIQNKSTPIDVVLGFNDLESYLKADERYHGVTVGRFANRITGGKFKLDDTEYQLEINNGLNALHSGTNGFHDQVWEVVNLNHQSISLKVNIKDLEDGFPGDLECIVTFSLDDNHELSINYKAISNKKTVINLTNHAYFNLNGEGSGDVLNHQVKINASKYTPIDQNCIPTGVFANVDSTPFDFQDAKLIKTHINEENEQLKIGKGYDHAFLLNRNEDIEVDFAASATGDLSGITLEVYTTEPAIQFYTGNYLSGVDIGKANNSYQERNGFCFETQHLPDSPNHSNFPSTILEANKEFNSSTIYKLLIRQ